MAAAKANNTIRVKGSIVSTAIGKSLFVSVPSASQYDPLKQEATILLTDEDTASLKATLQNFMDSPEVKESGLKDTGFVAALFKDDTDADGNPTGLSRVKAKTAMQYPCKLYTSSGTVYTPAPGFTLPNRADIRMSFRPEVMKTSMFTGIVLRLQAIKIINMPSFDDGMAAFDDGDAGSFTGDAGAASTTPADGETGAGTDWE